MNTTTRRVALAAAAAIALSLPIAATPAEASPVRGEVDVCVMKSDVPKSWTKGLEKKANKAFKQKIDVHRIAEDDFGGCDVVVWTGGRVAVDYITGKKAPNPRFHVYTGEYAMAAVEINVGRVTPKKKRPATLVKALKVAGIR